MAGRKTKDREVVEGFNRRKKGGMTRREENAAKRQAALEKQQADLEARQLEARMAAAAGELEVTRAKLGLGPAPAEPVAPAGDEADDEKSAYQMLQDMRHVYASVKGRDKLQRLVKDDDKQFVFMVRELIRIESALMTARIKAKDEGQQQQQTVFVVLKGLEAEGAAGVVGTTLQDVLSLEGGPVVPRMPLDERKPEDG
jgi:hypothetical protein